MRLRFNVTDSGNSWLVVGPNNSEEVLEGSNIYEVFSWEVYEFICININNGCYVYIPKNLSGELTVDDISVLNDDNELEKHRRTSVNVVRDYMYTYRLSKIAIIDYFTFTMLNNYFANMGFYITNENREEQYLAIVTKISEMENQEESDKIIAKLEEFLNIIDKLTEYEYYLIKLRNTIYKINSAESIEEIDKIVNDLKEIFK